VDEARWLTFDDFAGREGEHFSVVPEAGAPTALELVEATRSELPGGTGPDGRERQQFALEFAGPSAPQLAQATYHLEHADLGPLDVFLVPIGPGRYQAVFA
jgi:hypothetical protein